MENTKSFVTLAAKDLEEMTYSKWKSLLADTVKVEACGDNWKAPLPLETLAPDETKFPLWKKTFAFTWGLDPESPVPGTLVLQLRDPQVTTFSSAASEMVPWS